MIFKVSAVVIVNAVSETNAIDVVPLNIPFPETILYPPNGKAVLYSTST